MTVGFYHAGPPSPHAALMVASVRRHMADVSVVQMSPEGTARTPGVTAVAFQPPQPRIARAVLEAYASVAGNWLLLDTDVLVLRDVREIFRFADFDIAVAERAGTFKPGEEGSKFMTQMPYNKGVVFSRSQAFWAAAVERIATMRPERQEWMGDQQAMCDVIASQQFRIFRLPNRFNYPPATPVDGADKAILHFKGPRKAWMAGRAA